MNNYYGNRSGWSFGGSGVPGMSNMMPPGVKYLLIANVAVFIMQFMFGNQFTLMFGLTPATVFQNLAIHQFFTYMFLHGGFMHIFFNMLMLWMFGRLVEESWGIKRFLKYYFLCGISGGVFYYLFAPNSMNPVIGASGAVLGLVVAAAVMFPNMRTMMFPLPIFIKLKWLAIGYFAYTVLNILMTTHSTVAHTAHLGGAVVGFLYLKLDWRFRKLLHTLSPLRFFRDLRYRKNSKKMEKNREKTEEIMKRVDSILDKINEVGIENISEEDRRFLGSASDILSKKDK